MDDIRVALAGWDQNYIERIKNYLEKQSGITIVGIAHDGIVAWDLIRVEKPDVCIMDMMMTGIDGIGVLELVKNLEVKPKIIMTTSFLDNTFITIAVNLGAEVLLKPFSEEALLSRTRSICGRQKEYIAMLKPSKDEVPAKQYNIADQVGASLKELGVPLHVSGYRYLLDAIIMAINDYTLINNITKIFYPAIADKHNTTASRAERAMRHALRLACERGNQAKMKELFGTSNYEKVTNSQFIAHMAAKFLLIDQMRQKIG